MNRGVIVLAALALLGCGDGQRAKLWTHDEIQDIASDVSSDAVYEAGGSSDVESRLDELETQIASQESTISSQAYEITELQSSISDLEARLSQLQ